MLGKQRIIKLGENYSGDEQITVVRQENIQKQHVADLFTSLCPIIRMTVHRRVQRPILNSMCTKSGLMLWLQRTALRKTVSALIRFLRVIDSFVDRSMYATGTPKFSTSAISA
jgi:hypothetical protein